MNEIVRVIRMGMIVGFVIQVLGLILLAALVHVGTGLDTLESFKLAALIHFTAQRIKTLMAIFRVKDLTVPIVLDEDKEENK